MEGVPQEQCLNTSPTQEDTSRTHDFSESATICLSHGK